MILNSFSPEGIKSLYWPIWRFPADQAPDFFTVAQDGMTSPSTPGWNRSRWAEVVYWTRPKGFWHLLLCPKVQPRENLLPSPNSLPDSNLSLVSLLNQQWCLHFQLWVDFHPVIASIASCGRDFCSLTTRSLTTKNPTKPHLVSFAWI